MRFIGTVSLGLVILGEGCAKTAPSVVPEASTASSAFVLPSAVPSPEPKAAVSTPAEAVTAFRSGWSTEVVRAPKPHPFVTRMDPVLAKYPEHFSAKRSTCQAERAAAEKFFTELKFDYTVHGAMSALDRPGDCWVIEYVKGMKEDLKGYVSPDGKVLFVWQIPEG